MMTETHAPKQGESPDNEREQILAALHRWINQRPGLDPRNYGTDCNGWSAYRSESRSITRDLHDARQLLAAVSWRTSIGAKALKDALRHSYSGRLTWNGESLDYCTGQYWPTEFRRAVCAVLASALWAYARDNMPEPVTKQYGSASDHPMQTVQLYDGLRAGDWLRRWARRELGARIARRWFN